MTLTAIVIASAIMSIAACDSGETKLPGKEAAQKKSPPPEAPAAPDPLKSGY